MSGASGLENQYVVDGTNVTNTGYGGLGSYSIIVRLARQRDAVRLHQGSAGQDRRVRGRVRAGDRRRRERDHQERGEPVARIGLRLHAADRPRRRLEAVPGNQWFGEHGVDEPERRRHRSWRPGRQGQGVLLRRDRSGLADAEVSRHRTASRWPASARSRGTAAPPRMRPRARFSSTAPIASTPRSSAIPRTETWARSGRRL